MENIMDPDPAKCGGSFESGSATLLLRYRYRTFHQVPSGFFYLRIHVIGTGNCYGNGNDQKCINKLRYVDHNPCDFSGWDSVKPWIRILDLI